MYDAETENDKQVVGRVEELAKRHGVSMTCIATAWCVRQGCMPIIGLNSKERIDEAVENVKFKLSDEDAKFLEEAYAPRAVKVVG